MGKNIERQKTKLLTSHMRGVEGTNNVTDKHYRSER